MSPLKCEKGFKELQAGWPNLGRLQAYLLEAVTGYMRNRQVTGNSQHGLTKDKSCLPTLPAFCAEGADCEQGESNAHYKDVKQCWPQH